MKASRELIRTLIPIAPSPEDADSLIVENYGFKTIPEKIAFLKGMYEKEVFKGTSPSATSERNEEMEYRAMLLAIMNS